MPECNIRDVLTVQWLKDTFLLGVDLTLDDNTDFPDTIFEQCLDFGIATTEHELGVRLDTVLIEGEIHDTSQQDRNSFYPFRMDERPLQKIDAMRLQYGNFAPIDFPVSWVRVVGAFYGQINIMPSSEALGSYLIRSGIPLVTGDVLHPLSYVPGYWEFDYTAGFNCWEDTITIPDGETSVAYTFPSDFVPVDVYTVDATITTANGAAGARILRKGKSGFTLAVRTPPAGGDATVSVVVSTIPGDVQQIVGLFASFLALAVAGDLVLGPGIASISTSMDGLSQSINSTASAMYSAYSARMEVFQKQLDKALVAAKSRVRAINMFSV